MARRDDDWTAAVRRRQWAVRRRLAVVAFASVVATVKAVVAGLALGVLDAQEVSSLTGLLAGYFTWSGAIVTAYIGFSAWHDVRRPGDGAGAAEDGR
ncbi:MAG TPA: hypothetical protein ENK13_02920 [Thermopetrobacter sp.]|nr:hypothetical protein [Thermopetrobacter sp.]